MILNFKKILSLFFLSLSLDVVVIHSLVPQSQLEQKLFEVNFFENDAGNDMGSIFEPGLDRNFTTTLQTYFKNQTNLQLVSQDADLIYEGEIIEYRVSPMTATSELTAAQNRLTISVNVRFINVKNEDDDFENRFSFYYDYPAEVQLVSIKSEAHDAIFERITQDIFNASLAKMVDISKTKFIEFLVYPNSISLDEANAIEKIINQYPYFNVAKAVQSIAFKNHNSTKFTSSLKRCSSSSHDRPLLRELITLEKSTSNEKIEEFKEDLDLLTTHNKNSFFVLVKKTKSVNYESKKNNDSLIDKFLQSDQKLNLNKEIEDIDITKNSKISKRNL